VNATVMQQHKSVKQYEHVWIYTRFSLFAKWHRLEAKCAQVVTQGKFTMLFYKLPRGRKWHSVNSVETTCWVVDKPIELPPSQIETTTDHDREIGVRCYTSKYPLSNLGPWEEELNKAIKSQGAMLLHRVEPDDCLGLIKPA
jgi:hypothetical protein